PYFAARSDYEAHDALLCVAEGAVLSASDRRRLSPEHWFKTRAEMTELFADLAEATEASVEIAMRCSARRARGSRPVSPIMGWRRASRGRITTNASASSST